MEFLDIKDEELDKDLLDQLKSKIVKGDLSSFIREPIEYNIPNNRELIYTEDMPVPWAMRKLNLRAKFYQYLLEKYRGKKVWAKEILKDLLMWQLINRKNPYVTAFRTQWWGGFISRFKRGKVTGY